MRTSELYFAFRRYGLKPKIEGCPHCELQDTDYKLHSAPLRDLTWDDLAVFLFKSMTTFGDLEDFKHFLPRIIELYITDIENDPYGTYLLFSKLEYAKWHNWPANEIKTLELGIIGILQRLVALERLDPFWKHDRENFESEARSYGLLSK